MDKRYEEMKLSAILGLPLHKVVTHLLDCHENGRLVSVRFNGVMLYSDTVTMDGAYLKIVGKTKAELAACVEMS